MCFMKLRITPYGYRECIILSTVALVLSGLIFGLAYCLYKESLLVLGVIPLFFFIFVLFFFRDPERRIPEEKEKIVAPADGKITEISEVFEEEYLKNEFNLSIVLIYAWLIADIEDYGLWQSMPGNFNSAEEAIEQLGGLPRTKQARIKTLFA